VHEGTLSVPPEGIGSTCPQQPPPDSKRKVRKIGEHAVDTGDQVQFESMR
jgi:hypothetical protein